MPSSRYTQRLDGPVGKSAGPVRLGGKGASLVRLAAMGVRVPIGFGVTVEAFQEYIRGLGLETELKRIESRLGQDVNPDLANSLRGVQSRIIQGDVPKPILDEVLSHCREWRDRSRAPSRLIVRSSATVEDSSTHSYAGIFSSIPVDGPDDVARAMKEVWASVFSPRAVAYYRLSGLKRFPAMALIVQPFLEAQRSGVMFTEFRSPEGDPQILIEHVEGECEKLVSGTVTPERLWLRREPGSDSINRLETGCTPDHRLETGATLKASHARELADVARTLEQRFGAPQDVEWCILDEQLYILQSRPITTVSRQPPSPARSSEHRTALLTGVGASGGRASGLAHLVFNIHHADALQQGQVLVTPMTNPDMVTAMRNSCAVVTDVGGMICHAAIVSRELGIPCIVGTEKATTLIKQNDRLTVDGDAGKVYSGLSEAKPAESCSASVDWPALWAAWTGASPQGSIPCVSSLQGLDHAPTSVTECALIPYVDLISNEQAEAVCLDRLNDSERAEHLKRYLNRAAKMAKERRIERILILPLYLRPYRTALAAAQQGISTKLELLALSGDPSEINSTLSARDSCGTRYALVLDPSVETLADVASGVIPIIPLATAKLASVSMNSLPKHATAGPSGGVFGRMPAMRAVPMPDPAKRQGYCDLVPALNGAYRNRSQPSEQSYEWLDLRPEVPITPILKSLVLAGMETIPAAMGFTDLEPMYVTWMRCRFHFRKDTFIALWMRLQQAAWDESFMTVMLERVHQTYARLGRAANVFPMTETDWQKASSAQLREWFIPWWHAFVDFFSQSFFIQALGDDGMFPYVAKTVAANLEKAKAAGLDALGTWPGVAELTAPTTPVLTAEYLADLARLKQALTEAGRTALESAMDAVSEGPKRNPKVIAALNEHLSRWHWMRERDPYYEPYDQPRVVLEKALATREAPAPDYAGNARSNLLALSLHFDLTHGISDPKKWVHAVRYGQALSADRENHHVVWLKCSYPFRKLCLEWERRLKERVQGSGFRVQEIKEPMRAKDIFFMEVPEILEAIEALPNPLNADFLAKVHNRRAAYHRELKLKIAGEPTPEPVEERDYY